MSILGLEDSTTTKTAVQRTATKTESKKPTKTDGSQSDEAKAMLAKMKAKNDAGDCAFC